MKSIAAGRQVAQTAANHQAACTTAGYHATHNPSIMASQRTATKADITTGLIVKAGTSTRCASEAQDTIRAETSPQANAAINSSRRGRYEVSWQEGNCQGTKHKVCHRGPGCHSTFSPAILPDVIIPSAQPSSQPSSQNHHNRPLRPAHIQHRIWSASRWRNVRKIPNGEM